MESSNEPPLSDEFSLEGFTSYLRSPLGGNRSTTTAKSIISDLITFFSVTAQSSSDNYYKCDRLCNRTNLEVFLHYIKAEKAYKPTTVTEKLRRLKLAIRYIMDKSKDHDSTGDSLLQLLTQWCHSLSQDVTIQRKEITKYADSQSEHGMVCSYSITDYSYTTVNINVNIGHSTILFI